MQRIFFSLVVVGLLLYGGWGVGGCGSTTTTAGDGSGAGAGGGGDVGTSDPVSGAGSFSATTGFSQQALTIGGDSRQVNLYAPAGLGTQPPLVIAFHGTSGTPEDILTGGDDGWGLKSLADTNGFVVAAPRARDWGDGVSDWDNHGGNDRFWETRLDANPSRGSDPDANADLVLVKQIITAAQAAFNIDPKRVYLIGFSNGGFFSELAAMVLRDQIAAFAEAGSGLVTCGSTGDCTHESTGTTCGAITGSAPASCTSCSGGTEKPTTVPTSGRLVPGILGHNDQDDTVSSFYTCAMYARMQELSYDAQVVIGNAVGHGIPDGFIDQAWDFFSTRQLP